MTSSKILPRLLTGGLLIVLLLWIALRDPQAPSNDSRVIQRESLTMGTLLSLSVYLDDGHTRAQAGAALTQVEQRLQQFDQQWSAWGDGELGRINRALGSGKAVMIPETMRSLFAESARAHVMSDGHFDVRIGALVKLWGFDDEAHYRKQPPATADIERLRAALASAVPLDATRLNHYPPLDFGAIAKGYAADLAIVQLRQAGFANAIVNLGGNLRVSGRRGDRPWSIGIRHPRPDEHTRILASLKTHGDEAVITSGDYERYFEFEGHRYHHILDPATGAPAQGLQSVTVIYPEGAWADAASTALFVAGPQHWRETAARMNISQVLVVDADGLVTVTQALVPRLELAQGIKLKVVP
jgi:thiamine biosynthesis lipoprotein